MSILIPADGGQRLGRAGSGIIKIRGQQTNGRIGVVELALEVGRMIRPHQHDHDVWLHVLTGEVGVRVGDETVIATAWDWVLKPRDVPHAMWNAGSVEARVMEVFTPAGFEEFMWAVTEADQRGELDPEKFSQLCDVYGIQFFDDWPGEEGWLHRTKDKYALGAG
jgi:quercetin dioxygenase-like cupin family protein